MQDNELSLKISRSPFSCFDEGGEKRACAEFTRSAAGLPPVQPPRVGLYSIMTS
ncbi:hypothetical protein Slin15195_G021130 [Septoria linicola]|uniref:Uncharacterized protein n=1 Tax=Septoria linicola TaxID=215465 RepID=A0A9Q9EGC9_9PEZI|nr:hypothetical protein Slin14017_G021190 [Septoria linicola]USW48794.1 hypothetical protein Slin15195_G021130 [Septoria linicola]